MPTRFRCRQCEQLLSVSSRKVGKVVECPKCAASIVVPAEDKGWGELYEPEAAAPQPATAPEPEREPEPTPGAPALAMGVPAAAGEEDSDEEGFALKRRASEFDDMDLTPMVDVTFLLLIFFMISATFSAQKAIKFPAPEPEKQGAQQTVQMLEDFEASSIIVQIDEKNRITVDYEPLNNPSELADVFRDKMRTEQKAELLIEPNDACWHETVVAVVDAASEVGMQKIRLAGRSGRRK